MAAPGPAATPTEHRVVAGVHADTVSTFLDDGQLVLGSKADVEEGNGTRFAAHEVWFHLEDTAWLTLPAGYEFVAPDGSTVWMAEESKPGPGKLWPGLEAVTSAKMSLEFAFNHAWRRWPEARYFASIKGYDPGKSLLDRARQVRAPRRHMRSLGER